MSSESGEPVGPADQRRSAVLVTHEAYGADDTGAIRRYLVDRGFSVAHHSVFPHGEIRDPDLALPDTAAADLVVVFGSFAHAWQQEHQDWVEAEISWVRRVVESDIAYVGVCFGGQLLTRAWGGRVEPGNGHEIGMLTFQTTPDCPIPGGPWFSWHSDRVVLPPDVTVWSRSDFGPQIFTRGRSIGVQFHPEITHALVDSWIRAEQATVDKAYGSERLRAEVDADIGASQTNLGTFLNWVIEAWV
ncbi:type 1 glutamine amidotransferase [Streptomyces zhihengii]|uniref:Type 1 glutamine amidotransferase n=1 Tax=Streptomyces zhihengii TaxID=1818004 RepID=A0ABS2V6F1_9ACTN|nr:type 1 glutamine amidotransferase [Streptomyces zhihengii]MBM9624627.1 type 1 glutamine amidotransferase [Streptomyces zhihengii]